jgi:ADP-heptose:LPS heptosyltransferase
MAVEGDPERPRLLSLTKGEGLGDGLLLLPYLRALRRAFPGHHILHATSGESVLAGALARFVDGLVDELRTGIGTFRGPWPQTRALRALPAADLQIVLDTRWSDVLAMRLASRARVFVCGLPGYVLSDRRPADRRRPGPQLARTLALVAAAAGRQPAATTPDGAGPPLAALPAERERAAGLLPAGHCYVGLALGVPPDRRAWPLQSAADLARWLDSQGVRPVFVLGPLEVAHLPTLRAMAPTALFPGCDDGSYPSFELALAIAERLAGAVVKDGGLAHLLAAAGVPLVDLISNGRPWHNFDQFRAEKWRPWGAPVEILTSPGPGGRDPSRISVEVVRVATARMLASAESPPPRAHQGGSEMFRLRSRVTVWPQEMGYT